MADMSDTRANAVLGTEPTLYVALSSTLPTLAGGNITEPAQSDYVRPAITLAAASSRARVTSAVLNFISGGGTASGSAGNFGYYALMTAASGGTMNWRGTLTPALAWVAGQNVQIPSGNLSISLPNTP